MKRVLMILCTAMVSMVLVAGVSGCGDDKGKGTSGTGTK